MTGPLADGRPGLRNWLLTGCSIAALLAEANPSWRLHDIACGGHMAPLARPDVVNPLIAQVLDEALM